MGFVIDEQGNYLPVFGENAGGGGDIPANVLRNTATGTDDITILGTATDKQNAINIGYNSSVAGNHSTVIGTNASAGGASAIALGRSAKASANYAIQIGQGTNSTAKTMNVGFDSTQNYQLLDGETGKIPSARYENFIPDSTITVETDGTGDFTTLSAALEYIANKWSNGRVAIILGEGTFTESESITIPRYNFSGLVIQGQGVDKTTLNIPCTNASGAIVVNETRQNIWIQKIFFNNSSPSISGAGICALNGGSARVTDSKFSDYIRGGFITQQGGTFWIGGTNEVANTSATGMRAAIWCGCGNIYLASGSVLKVKNIAENGLLVTGGGIIQCNGATYQINSVTNRYNVTRNTIQEAGIIIGSITEGTY